MNGAFRDDDEDADTYKSPFSPSGYPPNWDKISTNYRESKGYICEVCRVPCNGHKKLLHVHHIDGDKQNCDDDNLQCLCVFHHSEQPMHSHLRKEKEFNTDMQALRKLWEEQDTPHDKRG